MPIGSSINLEQSERLLGLALGHTKKLLTEGEKQLCAAVQRKPVLNIHPHSVVVTNKRVIKHQPRLLGATFTDFLWKDMVGVHLEDTLFGSRLVFEFNRGVIATRYLPKDQAKKVYSIAQEKEEEWVEKRRLRNIEEERAKSGANHIIVGKQSDSNVEGTDGTSIRSKLLELKNLLDEGLLTQDEYQTKKAKILKEM